MAGAGNRAPETGKEEVFWLLASGQMAFSRRFLFQDDVLIVLGIVLGVLALGLGIALALLPILT